MLPSGTKRADAVVKDSSGVTGSSEEHETQASIAAEHEENLSFTEAISSYPAAVFWSLFFSLGVIMAVRSSFYGSKKALTSTYRLLIRS